MGMCDIICIGSVFSISLHPSGELACSGGEDDKARVWKVADGSTLFLCEGNTGRSYHAPKSQN